VRGRPTSLLLIDCWVLVLALLLLWPQRLAGYGLGHDMVFTPRQPLTWQSVGLGSAAPRAVPLDALVALASKVAPGAVIGRIALLAPLLLAGWGAARLLRPRSAPALLAVAGLAVWNPYVVERLALGQWALLWAYGALPWLVRAAGRLGCQRGWRENSQPAATMLCCLACCAITPTGALVGAGVAVAVTASRRVGRTAAVLAAVVLVQLPWLVPALTSAAGATSDPRAVAAFAARPERPGGALLSLLGLGGIWSADVTPASRAGLLGYASTAAVLAALALGVPVLRDVLGVPMWRRLLCLAGTGLLLAVAGSVPGLSALLRWAVRELPGAGLLRDGQKWLMPFVLLAVLATGAAVQRLTDWLPELPGWPAVLASLALPLVLLPDAPAVLKAPLTPVRYPVGWQQVAERVRGSDAAVLVLPFAAYRSYSWAPGRTVLDPAPRWLAAETVVDDRLVVSGTVLAGEDRTAQRVAMLLQADPPAAALARALAEQGIGWVVREADTPGPPIPELAGLQPVLLGGAIELYRVPGPVAAAAEQRGRRWWVVLLDLLTAAVVGVAIVVRAGFAARGLLHSPVTSSSEDS